MPDRYVSLLLELPYGMEDDCFGSEETLGTDRKKILCSSIAY